MQVPDRKRGRNLALCCANWSDPSNVHAWTWMKQYMLQKAGPVKQGLDPYPGDYIYVVHVGKNVQERWKMGGPLIPDLETCMNSYPHEVVDLEGSLQGNIRAFLEREKIDVVVFGNRYPQSVLKALSLLTVREWIQQHVSVPYVFIRPEAVRNVRMRLCHSPEPSPASMAAPSPPSHVLPPRRIVIAYSDFGVGRALLQVSRELLLEPHDTVDVVHVYPSSGDANPVKEVMRGTLKLVRAITLPRAHSGELSEAETINFGAAELAGYKANLNVILRGDVKAQLTAYVDREKADLLIIGSHSANAYQTKLSGGTTSGYLMEHASCPVLVVPYAVIATDESSEGIPGLEEAGSPSAVSSFFSGPTPASRLSHKSFAVHQQAVGDVVMVLQQQLEEKDRVIAELRAQLAALQAKDDEAT